MSDSYYLFAAFAVTWIFLFGYISTILKRQLTLEKQIDKLQEFFETED
ncbi:MAG: CcmD family protein [Deltaproteobacteria bacterium]|nr:CcmD family protein [Deltaproteobacteria bacterium]